MPITPVGQLVAQPVTWLWPDRLPVGKVVIIDGDPDLGKSLLTLDFCARLSTGRAFPDGRPGLGPANALVLSAEDAAADTIAPRLRSLGADLRRVFVWQPQHAHEPWPWRFPGHAVFLDRALAQSDARLAVIDPVMAFLDNNVLSSSDQSVRLALGPLIQLAQKHRCTLILLRHLNKQGGGRAVYRGLGSIGFTAASRVALLVGRDPQAAGRCVLAQVRNSLAGAQPSLAYRITAGDGGLPVVDWLGSSPLSADELLAGTASRGSVPRDQAVVFLQEFLADGPRSSHEVLAAAHEVGLTERTLWRAKAGLGVRCRRVHREGRQVSYWQLDPAAATEGVPTAEGGLGQGFGAGGR